jgi:hypothetical protein
MTPLTAKALSDQEDFYARVRLYPPTIFFSFARKYLRNFIIPFYSLFFYVTTRLRTRILSIRFRI